MGLEIDRKEFYNLLRKRSEVNLTDQEEARMIITYLSHSGCYVFVDKSYVRALKYVVC
jgi:hypothetical protein